MSYQKCPICNGAGKVSGGYVKKTTPCRTCNGTGLINEDTGQPPIKPEVKP